MRDGVIKVIKEFLKENTRVFFNENELQMYLAQRLQKENYEVFLEYLVYLPGEDNRKPEKEYTKIYLDIVVVKKGKNTPDQYMPIELKYKVTNKSNKNSELPEMPQIFGNGGEKELTTQGAHNNGCYDFWRDVERIETIHEYYNAKKCNMEHGVAVIVTNDSQYWTLTDNIQSEYYNFRLLNDRKNISGTLKWGNNNTIEVPTNHYSRQKPINLSGVYTVNWQDIEYGFKYLILP